MAIPNGVQSNLDEDNIQAESETEIPASEVNTHLLQQDPNDLINPQSDHFKIITRAYNQTILSSYAPQISQISTKLGFEILLNQSIKWIFYQLIELGYYEAVYGIQSAQYIQAQRKYRDYYHQVEQGTDVNAKKLLKLFEAQDDQGKQSLLSILRQEAFSTIRQIVKNEEH
jgi:hypothetical protein